ncbi:MAG: hypothetical protein LBC18_11805 [Opitutaceae bacterium]|jgi:type VI secretion system protein ImpL|nr:hypothetical protein [Opitutaceae bacterium]
MKTLGAILKILLWGFLVATVLAGLTLLAWWMRWPMFTGVFIVLGLAAGVLLFFALRFCWRLRNKRRFVEQALSGLQSPSQPASVAESPLETLWNSLLLRDRQGYQRAIDPRDFLERAWYVVLDATGSLSPIFAENPSRHDAALPIARHDFAMTTLLQVREAALDGADKEELLTLMARDVKKGVLRGLVLLLSLDELKADDQGLHEHGYLLRTRLYELIASLNRSLPLFVLVEDVDQLPGGQLLFARPDAENWGGRFFPDEEEAKEEGECPGREAARAAVAMLRECFYDDLVAHRPTSGDELLCFERLEALGERLDQLFLSLMQGAPRHDPLRLSGIFFCPTGKIVAASSPADAPRENGTAVKRAERNLPHVVLTRFFAQTLPAGGGVARALKGCFSAYSTGWLTAMSAWLLFLLAICGLLAADTLYQKRALTTAPPALSSAMAALKLAPLQGRMNYILQLEEAQTHWLLPSFGLDALGEAAREEKQEFTQRLYRDVLPPLVDKLRKVLEATGTEGYNETQHAALTQLSWLSNVVNERLRKGKTVGAPIFFPLTDDDGWNTTGSELIRAGLNWTENPDQLKMLSGELGSVITRFIGDHFPVFSESIIDYYNGVNTDQQVCLSQYWPHLAVQGEEDFCIPAYYTAASYAVNSEFFNSFRVEPESSATGRIETSSPSSSRYLNRLSDRGDATNASIRRMFDAYHKQYAEYWLTFAQKFIEVSANVSDEAAYETFYAIKNLGDTPHLKLLERMTRELAPLGNADPPPAWFADVGLFEVMYAVAMEGHSETNPAAWHTLLMAGTRMPDVLQTLWQEADNRQHMREIYDGIMAMTQYLGSVREVLHDLGNRSLSLTLARTNYSGKEQEGVKQHLYQEAKQHLATALTRFSRQNLATEIPQARIFASLLDFAGNGIVLEAALAVQQDWESKVLSSPIYRFSNADVEKMYGKEGIVSSFVQTDLKLFLDRRVDGTVAAVWDGHVFPFTDDFLHFVGTSEEWAARFHPAPGEEHPVRMRSSPPQVNVDARSRPNGYTVNLACQDKNWWLINRNYPHDEPFVYNQAICGQVTLRVDFPGFTLERQWPDFLRFARDFLYGEKDFTPEDFPDSAAFLKKANVKSLRIPLLPDGAAQLLRDEAVNAPVVPERIVYVRE